MTQPNKNAKRKATVYSRDGGTCWICGNPVSRKHASVDHIIPKSKGGTNALTNLRLAHKSCNNFRGNADA